jgi:hypothetical protein
VACTISVWPLTNSPAKNLTMRCGPLAAGLSVFYLDDEGLDVMEQADGRRFEIRWIPGAPSGENYEILREIKKRAA